MKPSAPRVDTVYRMTWPLAMLAVTLLGAGCENAGTAKDAGAKTSSGEGDSGSALPPPRDSAMDATLMLPAERPVSPADMMPDVMVAAETPRPDVAPDVAVDVTPDLAPDVAPDLRPDLPALDVAPDLAADTEPDVAPDVTLMMPDMQAECVSGTRECMGNSARVCGPTGSWQMGTTCPFVCAGGTCGGACVPGAARCTGSVAERCSIAGMWATEMNCPFACVANACAGVCKPGAKMCEGTGLRTCGADGQWGAPAACPGGCSGTTCLLCSPGTSGCLDVNTRRVCDLKGENWVNVPCALGCSLGQCNPTIPTWTCVCGPGSCGNCGRGGDPGNTVPNLNVDQAKAIVCGGCGGETADPWNYDHGWTCTLSTGAVINDAWSTANTCGGGVPD